MNELPFPMAIRRLTLKRGDGGWEIADEARLEGTLPAPLELPDTHVPVTGSWWEAVDKDGRVLYRERLEDPFDPSMELFDEDGSISRVDHPPEAFAESEHLVELLVPDAPGLDGIRFVRASAERTAEGRVAGKQDVETLRLDEAGWRDDKTRGASRGDERAGDARDEGDQTAGDGDADDGREKGA